MKELTHTTLSRLLARMAYQPDLKAWGAPTRPDNGLLLLQITSYWTMNGWRMETSRGFEQDQFDMAWQELDDETTYQRLGVVLGEGGEVRQLDFRFTAHQFGSHLRMVYHGSDLWRSSNVPSFTFLYAAIEDSLESDDPDIWHGGAGMPMLTMDLVWRLLPPAVRSTYL
ncbi:MAG: hypothetical protein R3313_02605 [Candidatus Saccharimonadales bacterium]|nr:hypothetical protein [Candidatus Saccharimonadales bacterium]